MRLSYGDNERECYSDNWVTVMGWGLTIRMNRRVTVTMRGVYKEIDGEVPVQNENVTTVTFRGS
jgi:hypothetical protein